VANPGLASNPEHELAAKLLSRGAGAIFSFGIWGGRDAGARFIESVRLFSHLANVGDLRSLVIHPGSTTHQQMTDEQLASAGIGEEMIRVSVGLEDPDDLISDLDRALQASQRGLS
jgi:O-acetylhomoserine (thiol)-lyase